MLNANGKKLCSNCFGRIKNEPCPVCGYKKSAYKPDVGILPVGTMLKNRYSVGEVLGKGGFGVTYKAYDTRDDKIVAIKEYYPNGLVHRDTGTTQISVSNVQYEDNFRTGADKFFEEAKTVSRFNGNPNIVNVYEFFFENGTVYYSMEFLDGVDLKHYIKNNGGKLSQENVLYIANVVSDALLITHSMDVLHRDISPDNIFVLRDGRIKLIDFGAARQVLAEQSKSLSVILKQGFAPLEQYQRRGKQGPWTDIYALGATLYYALTGKMPDEVTERLDFPEIGNAADYGVDADFWEIIRKCMEVKISDRCQNIPELKAMLKKLEITPAPMLSDGAAASGAGAVKETGIGAGAAEKTPDTASENRTAGGKKAAAGIVAGIGAGAAAGAAMSKTAAAQPDMPKTAAAQPDMPKTTAAQPDMPKTTAAQPDMPKTVAAEPDMPKTVAAEPDMPKTVAAQPDMPKTVAAEPDMPKTVAAEPDMPKTTAGSGAENAQNDDSENKENAFVLFIKSAKGKAVVLGVAVLVVAGIIVGAVLAGPSRKKPAGMGNVGKETTAFAADNGTNGEPENSGAPTLIPGDEETTRSTDKPGSSSDKETTDAEYTNQTTKPADDKTKPSEKTESATDTTKPGTPTEKPTENTTKPITPTEKPTENTTKPIMPTEKPTAKPTQAPTQAPTTKPTQAPTAKPTQAPTQAPTAKPTQAPTQAPTVKPTQAPTQAPTTKPTQAPTQAPTTAAPTQPAVDIVLESVSGGLVDSLRGRKKFKTNFPQYLKVTLDGVEVSLSKLSPEVQSDGTTLYTVDFSNLGGEKFVATVKHPSGAEKTISGNAPTVSGQGGVQISSSGTYINITVSDGKIEEVTVKVDGNTVKTSELERISNTEYRLDVSKYGKGTHSCLVTRGSNNITLSITVK